MQPVCADANYADRKWRRREAAAARRALLHDVREICECKGVLWAHQHVVWKYGVKAFRDLSAEQLREIVANNNAEPVPPRQGWRM